MTNPGLKIIPIGEKLTPHRLDQGSLVS